MSEAKLLCSRQTKESVMSVTLKVCVVTAALNLSQTFSVIMALRRSRRLQQLQPEETNLGVCLICQGDFTIEVLHRLRNQIAVRRFFTAAVLAR